jgi:hypothetical protein
MAINGMGQMMKMATKSTQAGQLGESLEQVKQHFAQWRARRKPGSHMSDVFWAAAVGLVERHGLRGVARELGVDYGRLKKRFERGMALPAMAGKDEVQFVEMFAAPAVAPQAGCIVEMENARGAKMRIELKSLDGLAGLTSAFWSAR